MHMGWSRGGNRGSGSPLKNHKNMGFLSNTGPDPLKNHKATKSAFNFEPLSAHQRNTILNGISLVGRWWPELIVVFVLDPLSPLKPPPHPPPPKKNKKKTHQCWTPSDKTLWICPWCIAFVNSFDAGQAQQYDLDPNCLTDDIPERKLNLK